MRPIPITHRSGTTTSTRSSGGPSRRSGSAPSSRSFARFLGRRLAYDYEFVEFEPGVRLVMRTQQGPFPMETTYTWAAAGGGTHMTLSNRGTPTGFSTLAALVMVPAMRRANRKDLAKLKSILEST
jgi:hypothetical protein